MKADADFIAQQQVMLEQRYGKHQPQKKHYTCPYTICLHKRHRLAGKGCFAHGCYPAEV